MLEYLDLEYVGPCPALKVELASRLNFLVGDNGLGKTFLLDVAWWVLTRTWARTSAVPQNGPGIEPIIRYGYQASRGPIYDSSCFKRKSQEWVDTIDRLEPSSVVIYAQLDGGFSVWDPARNHWSAERGQRAGPPAFLFSPDEVWNGLEKNSGKKVCNGLIQDWATWQMEKGESFAQISRVLGQLSPSPEESLTPGNLRRVSLDDVRDHPTLKMPYDQEVALIHASAGIRRIVALSYLLVWSWREHRRASEIIGEEPVSEVILLIDEMEVHLHPRWQRRIVPALLGVMGALCENLKISVQIVTATHSPLVLASVEPYFDETTDSMWELDIVDGQVKLGRSEWRRYGDVNSWLSSSIFDLAEPRSVEAEEGMGKAMELLRRRPVPSLTEFLKVDEC